MSKVGIEVQLYSFLNLDARWGWVVNATRRPLYPPEKNRYPLCGRLWAPGPIWTGAENIAPTGIRSPDCPARSESLNRLSYPGPQLHLATSQKQVVKISVIKISLQLYNICISSNFTLTFHCIPTANSKQFYSIFVGS
jgi:hypothetical protein